VKTSLTQITSQQEKKFAYLILVIPALLIYYAVVAFPTIFSVVLSLTNYNGGKVFGNPNVKFAGLASYFDIFTNPNGYFYIALKNNMLIVLVSVFGQIPLGFILAYILSRKLVKGVDFFPDDDISSQCYITGYHRYSVQEFLS
jgi:raffinose/stachyose/melibiose transport system permease protein